MTPRRLLAPVIVALVMLGACGSAPSPAAKVGDIDISNDRLAANVKLFSTLFGISRQPCGQPDPGESSTSACSRRVLTTLIQEAVMGRYAQSHHLVTTPAQVSTAANGLLGQLGGADRVHGALRGAGVSDAEFRAFAGRVVVFDSVQQAVSADQVTNAQALASYQANISTYTLLHAEHILLKTKAQADAVYAQVGKPGFTEQDFLDLAKNVSTDPSAAQNSGDLGSASASGLDPTFVQAALTLQPGEISPPVHTSFGWHVIRLVETSVTPFQTVKADIERTLGQNAFQTWLHDQLSAAAIRINPRYGRWDASLPGVVPIQSTATVTPAPPSPASPAPGSGSSGGAAS